MISRCAARVLAGFCIIVACYGCATEQPLKFLAAPPPVPRTGGIYHRVERGQTLWRIAQQYQVSLDALARANQLEAPTRIVPGQLVWIPGAAKPLPAQPLRAAGAAGTDSFQWPVRGEVIAYFGGMQQGSPNRGVDIRVAPGTSVRAARHGRVAFIDTKMPGYGKTVILDHEDGFSTVYAWNGELLVQLGQTVTQATPIATVGSSGRAPLAALHFEIRRRHVPQNPFYFLP